MGNLDGTKGARECKGGVRSVRADVSEEIFEQHVDLFGVHVLAHVIDPNNRNVGIPGRVAMSSAHQRLLRGRADKHSRNAVFHPAHALPYIVENG